VNPRHRRRSTRRREQRPPEGGIGKTNLPSDFLWWRRKNWNWTAISTVVTAIATFVIAGASIGSVLVSCWQWSAINGQLTEMKNQSAITRTQLKANLKLEYKKRIFNQGWAITPSWQNVGVTDAEGFDGWVTSHLFIPASAPDNFDFFSKPPLAYKDFPTTIPAGDSNLLVSQHVSTDDMAKMEANSGLFIIWGSVQYKDVFGSRHHVRFCVAEIPTRDGSEIPFSETFYKPECNVRD